MINIRNESRNSVEFVRIQILIRLVGISNFGVRQVTTMKTVSRAIDFQMKGLGGKILILNTIKRQS